MNKQVEIVDKIQNAVAVVLGILAYTCDWPIWSIVAGIFIGRVAFYSYVLWEDWRR